MKIKRYLIAAAAAARVAVPAQAEDNKYRNAYGHPTAHN